MTRGAIAILSFLFALAAGHAALGFIVAWFAYSPEKEQRRAYAAAQAVRDDAIVLRAAIEAARIRGEELDAELSRSAAETLIEANLGAVRALEGFGETRVRWVPGQPAAESVWIAQLQVDREVSYAIELRQIPNAGYETVNVELVK